MNLTLRVLGRRPDGYHDIESWVVLVDLHDDVVVRESDGLSLVVTGGGDAVPADARNLAWRAAEALADAAGRPPTAAITLDKRIPVGAGLGGGSSDAAATLLGLNALWRLDWPTERLAAVAARVGSDVPLFLGGPSCVIRGRGERVEPATDGWRGRLALVLPGFGVSTEAVYRAWSDRPRPAPSPAPDPWMNRPEGVRELASRLFNDLEPAAFACEPRLGALHRVLDGLDGRTVRMTGSGSGLFTLFDSEDEARAWLDRAGPRVDRSVRILVVSTL